MAKRVAKKVTKKRVADLCIFMKKWRMQMEMFGN